MVKYGFNSRSLLESIKDGSNAATADFAFDEAGRLTQKTLPNGLETMYEYNDANWVTKIALRQSASPYTIIQSFEYGYDNVGNRTWVKRNGGSGDVYQCDPTYQLTGVKYGVTNPEDGYDLATGASREVSYAYDGVGNRTQVVDDATITNYTTNSLNQYTAIGTNTGWTYDTNGNLTGDGTWTYGYDREGHLISAMTSGTSVSYTYDAAGRRIGKNVNGTITKYVYSGQDLIEERNGSGIVIAKYVYAGGIDNPVKVIKGGNTYYFQQDTLGSVTALVDSSGAVFETYRYDAFGKAVIKDASGNALAVPTTQFLFTGREYDAETGLYHYRTRAYSPDLGRFLQPDSINFYGGDMNLYRYCLNSPINHSDPSGKIAPIVAGIAVAVVGAVGAFLTLKALLDALEKAEEERKRQKECLENGNNPDDPMGVGDEQKRRDAVKDSIENGAVRDAANSGGSLGPSSPIPSL